MRLTSPLSSALLTDYLMAYKVLREWLMGRCKEGHTHYRKTCTHTFRKCRKVHDFQKVTSSAEGHFEATYIFIELKII